MWTAVIMMIVTVAILYVYTPKVKEHSTQFI